MLLSPAEVEHRGLQACHVQNIGRMKHAGRVACFKAHYGSSPVVLSRIWDDFQTVDIQKAKLKDSEMNEASFKQYLISHHFLWAKPKNDYCIASHFGVNRDECRGKLIWKWISKMAALKDHKIKWDVIEEQEEEDCITYTVDCVDFLCWEKKHPKFNLDKKMYSKKFAHAAFRYMVCISVHESKVLFVKGPLKPSTHDLTIARMPGSLMELVHQKRGNVGCGDRAMNTGKANEQGMFSTPNEGDPETLKKYKTQMRMRQETFFGRMKKYRICTEAFQYSRQRHRLVIYAICVILQYQMENGSPLYSV